jgi:hypothetical protein
MATRDPDVSAANTLETTPQLGDIRRISLSSVLRSIQRQGPSPDRNSSPAPG